MFYGAVSATVISFLVPTIGLTCSSYKAFFYLLRIGHVTYNLAYVWGVSIIWVRNEWLVSKDNLYSRRTISSLKRGIHLPLSKHLIFFPIEGQCVLGCDA